VKLADVSVRRPVFAIMMSLALIVLGWSSYGGLGLDLMPRTDSPTVNVRASLPGASAGDRDHHHPADQAAVNTINGIDELRCSSSQNNGNCTITFVLGRDIGPPRRTSATGGDGAVPAHQPPVVSRSIRTPRRCSR
jgi:HAE1 family hydrophobic/amphiphilic exporter-1